MSWSSRFSPVLLFLAAGAIAGCSSTNPVLTPAPTATPFPTASPKPTASPTAAAVGPLTFNVVAGASTGNQAFEALAFYPSTITVDAGDSITWTASAAEPHTVSFPLPGATPIPPTNPAASVAAGGSTVDGTAFVSSGFFAGGATYTLKFTKPGTYTYYSSPQLPIVFGSVVVQAAGSAYPLSQSGVASAAQTAIALDLSNAKASVSTVPFTAGSNMIAAGVSPTTTGGATSTVMRYLGGPTEGDDLHTTIVAGTTLTFKNLSNNVPHTVTFPAVGASPPAGPPFQAGSGGNTYAGNALVNSGPIGPGGTFAITFTTPGTYPYYCLFHDASEGMIGTITVTAAGASPTATPVPTATATATAAPTATPTPAMSAAPQVVYMNFKYATTSNATYGMLFAYDSVAAGTTAQPISEKTGSKIVFDNDDTQPHTASGLGTSGFPASFDNTNGSTAAGTTIDGGTGWSSGGIQPDRTSRVFTLGPPATYYFGCAYHYASSEMENVIISTS